MAKQNHYETLGVSKTATADEIKSAYRKLAKQYHPDFHPGDAAAAEKFKQINEANAVLSDEAKRKQYDYELDHPNMGGMGGNPFGGGFGGFTDMNVNDIFNMFNGFGGFGSMQERRTNRGKDEEYTVNLSFLDAVKGCVKDIAYMRDEPCSSCKGTGAKGGTSFKVCSCCGGTGRIRYQRQTIFGSEIVQSYCNDCGGTGRQILDKCHDCKGKGIVRKETKFAINIPSGVDKENSFKKRGFGNAAPNSGGECGDLYIYFRIDSHKLFTRQDKDLYVTVPISYRTAVLGGKILVPAIDETIELTIPEGTASGTKFCIRGKGVRTINGVGNLNIIVEIDIPTKLTKDQITRLNEYENSVSIRSCDNMQKYSANLSSLYGKRVDKQ